METSESQSANPYTLRSIYLRNSSVRIVDDFDPTIPGQPLAANFRTGDGKIECRETEFDQNNDKTTVRSCLFTTRFEFAYTRPVPDSPPQNDEDIEKLIVAQITADIAIDYLFNLEAFPPAEDDLKKWASTNVLLHSWPYWREFCHSMLVRMNLPLTMIPLIQFSQKQENAVPQ